MPSTSCDVPTKSPAENFTHSCKNMPGAGITSHSPRLVPGVLLSPFFVVILLTVGIFGLQMYSSWFRKNSEDFRNYGKFYTDVQTKSKACITLYSKLGDFQDSLHSPLHQEKDNDTDHDHVIQRKKTYCEKLWKLLKSCFVNQSNQYLSPSNKKDQYLVPRQPRPNILLIHLNPRSERPDWFLDLFLTHFLQNYQNKINQTVRHTPSLSCHSFISAYDLQHQDKHNADPNSIIVYGPHTFGVHSILTYPKSDYVKDDVTPNDVTTDHVTDDDVTNKITKHNMYILWAHHPVERILKLFNSQSPQIEISSQALQKTQTSSTSSSLSTISKAESSNFKWEAKNSHSPTSPKDEFLELMRQSRNISSFLRSTRDIQIPYIDNYLTRLLSFNILSDKVSCNTGTHDCFLSGSEFLEIGQNDLDYAIKIVTDFHFQIGVEDDKKSSIISLCSTFGMDATCFGKSAFSKLRHSRSIEHKTPEKPDNLLETIKSFANIDDSNELRFVHEELLRRNEFDLKLFGHLRFIFTNQVSNLKAHGIWS